MKPFCALLALVLAAQADDFQKRVRIEGSKVMIDDQVLYDGPWRNATVTTADFTGKRSKQTFREFEPWKQIILTVDGEEFLRVPVKSLSKPIAWPPLRLEDVQPSLKKLTETVGAKKTFVAMVSGDKGDVEIYRGPE